MMQTEKDPSAKRQAFALAMDHPSGSNDEDTVSSELSSSDVGDYSPEGCEKLIHRYIKRCLNPKCFLALLMMYGLLGSATNNGIFASSASSAQRALGLSATDWGLVATMLDVYMIFLLPFISFLGGKSHIPRWLGVSLAFFTAGAFLFTSPHFMFYDAGSAVFFSPHNYCAAEGTGQSVGEVGGDCSAITDNGNRGSILAVFLLAQFCVSVGLTALWILGPIFLDRNVSQQNMNMYLACLYSSAALGPAVGYLMNGKLLNLWVDPTGSPPQGLTPKSSLWTGNWWLAYIIFGVVSALFILPISCFPRYLPGTKDVRRAKLTSGELVVNHKRGEDTAFDLSQPGGGGGDSSPRPKSTLKHWAAAFSKQTISDVRSFALACKDILTPMRVFNYLAHGTENFAVTCFATFLPQIIEAQFGLSAAQTSILFGLVLVVGATSGILIGGWYVSWRKLDGVQTAKFCMVVALISIPFGFSFLLMGCERPQVTNLSENQVRHVSSLSQNGTLDALLTETCNRGCACNQEQADLVCINGQTFYNMCYAGCSLENPSNGSTSIMEMEMIDSIPNYSNSMVAADPALSENIQCSCAAPASTSPPEITPGYCKHPKNCTKWLVSFFVLIFFLLVFTFMNNVPASQVILRSTELKERSLAMALMSITSRLTGSVPAPLVFGYFLDKLCLVHSSGCEEGECLLPDNLGVRYLAMGIAICFKTLSFLFMGLSWYLYKRHQDKSLLNNVQPPPL